jgi:hypothetical protein
LRRRSSRLPFVVEKAIRPADGRVTWLVLDDHLNPVDQVTQFALYLDGGGASGNTVRAYVPRVCRFLYYDLNSLMERIATASLRAPE